MGNFISSTDKNVSDMLHELDISDINELFSDIPESVRLRDGLNIPDGMSEFEAFQKIRDFSEKNKIFRTILRGAGAYKHYIPAVVSQITSKEEFLTAYTPYQAEISQGLLQAIFEYQTMICELTGMDVSNASVYDGATAAAESAAMCRERNRNKFVVCSSANYQIRETIKTYCFGNGMEYCEIPCNNGKTNPEDLRNLLDDSVAGVYLQQPNFFGIIEDAEQIAAIAHSVNAKFVIGVNPIALAVMKTPAECGADICVGEGQPLGIPLSFGGPYLGFMAAKSSLLRKLPGRIVGETTDSHGNRAFVLTMQAREQHIRREKALSNICSNQALCALTAAVYMAVMGPNGLTQAAVSSMSKAHYFAEKLNNIGLKLAYRHEFFHEFVTFSESKSEKILSALKKNNILGGLPIDEHRILWCCTEVVSKNEIDSAVLIIKEALL